MSETARRIISNLFYFLSGDLSAKLIGFFAIVFVARKLGAGDFGKLGFAEAFFSYFIYIGIAGVDTIATRDVARDRAKAGAYLGNVMSLKLVLSASAYLLLCAAVLLLHVEPELRHLTLLYGMCLLPVALSTEWLFQGLERMRYIGLFRLLREALYLGALLAVFGFAGGIYSVPLVRFGAMLSAVLGLFVFAAAWGFRPGLGRDIGLWKGLLRQSYPILASQFLIIVIYQFSIIVLGLLGRTEEIGYFSAVQKMVLFFIGLAGVFWAVVFPTTASLYVKSAIELRAFEERVSKVICAVAVPVGCLGFVLAGPVTTFLYGDGYAKSAEILKILIWVGMFAFINGIFAQGLLATGRQKLFLMTVAVQTVLNVSLALLLVPKFGGAGGAASWLVAEAAGFFLYKRFYNQAVRFAFYRYLLKPLLASLAAACALRYFGSLNLLIALASGAFLYLLGMVFLRGIEIRELRMVYQSIWKT